MPSNPQAPRDDPLPDAYAIAHQAQETAARRRRERVRRARHRPREGPPASPDLPAASPTQQRGAQGERQAHAFLMAHGLRIVAQNLRCRLGEIDLVALEGDTLVFVEVRLRRHDTFGGAAASVNRAKRLRLERAARHFLPRLAARHCAGRLPACRFDVIAIGPDGLQWIRAAFEQD